MGENTIKALKWFVLMLFVIAGSWSFFHASQHDDPKTVMIGVLSYGLVFIVGSFWKIFRDKVLLFTLGLLIGGAFATNYLPFYVFKFTGYYIDLHYAILWAALMFVPGVPVMVYVIDKYDKT